MLKRMNYRNKWKPVRTIWPYPEGYGLIKAGTLIDAGAYPDRDTAQVAADFMNNEDDHKRRQKIKRFFKSKRTMLLAAILLLAFFSMCGCSSKFYLDDQDEVNSSAIGIRGTDLPEWPTAERKSYKLYFTPAVEYVRVEVFYTRHFEPHLAAPVKLYDKVHHRKETQVDGWHQLIRPNTAAGLYFLKVTATGLGQTKIKNYKYQLL